MKYPEAKQLAGEVVAILAPFCDRIEIAGSIRRKCKEIGDIEIVCIPKTELGGLFMDVRTRDEGFINAIKQWKKEKGLPTGRYTQRIYKGEKLDIFIANKSTWGYHFVVRTGSAEFSKMLADRWVKFGYRSKDCRLIQDGEIHLIREEEDMFKLLGLEYVKPESR